MTKRPQRGALGRGLSALIAETGAESTTLSQNPNLSPQNRVGVDRIHANPAQPRRIFNPEKLKDLTDSIREKGVIQPLILRPHPSKPGDYQIVAGERRWRAAQQAQVHEVPAVVLDLTDSETLELAIIENVQRADLSAIEEAEGYQQLIDSFGHTQTQLATALGKSRSHIANTLRLLTLPEGVRDLVGTGALSAGHARALVTADHPAALARRIVDQGLSVRQVEALVREAPGARSKPRNRAGKDADTRAFEAELSAQLGLKVQIKPASQGKGGELRIAYKDLEQLDGLTRLLSA